MNNFKPSSAFKFPSRYSDGCNRSCQHKYLEENPWFVYSKVEDAIFCLPCVLFATKELGHIVCTGFNAWSRKTKKFACHNSTHCHQLALSRADALKFSCICPESSITNCWLLINERSIVINRAIIVASSVYLLVVTEMITLLNLIPTKGTFLHFLNIP